MATDIEMLQLHTKPVRLIRLFAAVLVFAITLELCARLDDSIRYGAPFRSTYTHDAIFTWDELGRTGKPNASFRDYKLNSLGYRGPELHPGGVRILCIGASETFGLYEDPGKEFPRQIEDDLNASSHGGDFQVVNAGVAGQTIGTATIRIPQYIERVHPRFVVVYPTPANYIWLPFLRRAPATQVAEPKFESRALDKVRDAVKRMAPAAIIDYLRRKDIESEAAEYGKPMDRVSDESVSAFRADLGKMVDEFRGQGVTPILVTHANRFGESLGEKDREQLTAWRRFYPMLTEAGFLDMERRMNDAIRALAKEKQLPLVDGAAVVPPGDEYFGDAIHFTTKGSSLLASAIAGKILEHLN
jgi:lysophospholipase L1-like esterase